MMYMLKSETQQNIEACVAMPFSTIIAMDSSAERRNIKLKFPAKRDLRKIGRGNPMLARRRFKTMEDVDKGLAAISYESL